MLQYSHHHCRTRRFQKLITLLYGCSNDPQRQICTNALPPMGARLPAHRGHVEGTCPCVTRQERQRRRWDAGRCLSRPFLGFSLVLIYTRPAAGLTPLCSATLSLQVQALGEMQLNFSSYHLVKNVCPAHCLTSRGDNKTFYSQSHFFSKFVSIYRIYSKQMKEACFYSLPWTEHSVNQCNCRVFSLRHWTACYLA